jgi:hypothetical protein
VWQPLNHEVVTRYDTLLGGLGQLNLSHHAPIGNPDRVSVIACCVESRAALL